MDEKFSRTQLLLGEDAMQRLYKSKVAIFGIGGVGSYCLEALARAGIGKFILIDNDEVSVSNINRQLIANINTVGRPKVEVARERVLSINPNAEVEIYQNFFLPQNADEINLQDCNYIVDAIDTVSAKIYLAELSQEKNISLISSMGTGNKLDPTRLEIDDIYNTSICPLAKVMRKELKKRNIKKLKVIYSKEEPIKANAALELEKNSTRRAIPGSVSFVPSVAGLIIASEVVKDLIK